MKQIIIEVGSTVTKVNAEENNKLIRIKDKTIQFKKNYKEENKLIVLGATRFVNEKACVFVGGKIYNTN